MEVMVVLTIMGVIISMAVPSFQRAVERSRADTALANLRAICVAERYFWLENRIYTSDLSVLAGLDLLPPDVYQATGTTPDYPPAFDYSVSYSVTEANVFTATAVRTGTSWTGTFTVDQTGTVSGSVTNNEDGYTINPPATQ